MSPLYLLTNTIIFLLLSLLTLTQSRSTYIVHVSPSHTPPYSSLLHSLSSTSSSPPPHILYSYSHSATAFAARLTASQAAELRLHSSVLSVVPDRVRQLHTTHTPSFLGLADGSGLWPNSDYASDVIVGVLDTGIWPEIASFSDDGYDPVPATWNGQCDQGYCFPVTLCNRKLIGGRAFYKGMPHCSLQSLLEKWVLRFRHTSLDKAIEDGVHVISLSVGADGLAPDYYEDSIAIGGVHAAQSGVLLSCSAGNSGPKDFTVVNIAPWILTAGASTIDREFPADVVLGDGRTFKGVSLYSGGGFNESVFLEMVYGGDCVSKLCLERTTTFTHLFSVFVLTV